MMVLCNANAITEYDRRRSGLPNTLVVVEHEKQQYRVIVISLNIQHILTYE